jgi:ferredoxin
MRVIVDQNACVASGQCVLTAGDVFDQQEDGTVRLRESNPPADLYDEVRLAEALCPARAITVIE